MTEINTSTSTRFVGTGADASSGNNADLSPNFMGGMAAFILASIASYVSIEGWQTDGEMGFSNKFAKDSQNWAAFFLNLMDGSAANVGNSGLPFGWTCSDEAAMNMMVNGGWSTENKNVYMQEISSNLNIHNTEYNQATSNYSGLENGANQGASNASGSLANILSAMQAIASLMQSSAR